MTARSHPWILVLILAATSTTGGTQESDRYSGRPLTEVLAELRAGGLRIVYSSAVVDPSMAVENEPEGDEPRQILNQILAPHGLVARDGPTGAGDSARCSRVPSGRPGDRLIRTPLGR